MSAFSGTMNFILAKFGASKKEKKEGDQIIKEDDKKSVKKVVFDIVMERNENKYELYDLYKDARSLSYSIPIKISVENKYTSEIHNKIAASAQGGIQKRLWDKNEFFTSLEETKSPEKISETLENIIAVNDKLIENIKLILEYTGKNKNYKPDPNSPNYWENFPKIKANVEQAVDKLEAQNEQLNGILNPQAKSSSQAKSSRTTSDEPDKPSGKSESKPTIGSHRSDTSGPNDTDDTEQSGHEPPTMGR